MNWMTENEAPEFSLVLRAYEERNRTVVEASAQSERVSVDVSYRELEPSVGGGSVVVQDDRTKWEGLAQVAGPAGAVTSKDLHWRKEHRCQMSQRLRSALAGY